MWTTAFAVFEVVYLVVLSAWILLEKRSPVATVAWILALAALPGFGLVLFYLLGPRHLKRKRKKHEAARQAVRAKLERAGEQLAGAGSTELRQLSRLAFESGGDPPSLARHVEIFDDTAECYASIHQAIDAAEHHVHVCYYIFTPGEVGDRFLGKLIDAAKRGVQVRLLLDAVGSAAAKRKWLQPLIDAGGQAAFFNSVGFRRYRAPINFRNHRKIVVCDGQIGFTGGANVCDEYSGSVPLGSGGSSHGTPPWRDTHMRLDGPAVRWLQLAFFDDWQFTVGEQLSDPAYLPLPAVSLDELRQEREGLTVVQAVPGGPDHKHETIRNVYFASINQAQTRVWLTAAYFVPDEATLTALQAAAQRGVDVRVMVPREGDSKIVTAAIRSYFRDLRRSGVKVFEYVTRMHHAKTMVVDDDLAIVGSANFDARSFRLNFELMMLLYGATQNQRLAEIFEADLRDCRQVGERSDLPPLQRLFEAVARTLSPTL